MLSNAGNLIGVETTYCNSLESNATDFDSPQLILATVDSGSKYTTYNNYGVRGKWRTISGARRPLVHRWLL